MSEARTKKLVYGGPAQQVCYALAEHGYAAALVTDMVYELPEDVADALLRSNAHFSPFVESKQQGRQPFKPADDE